MWKRPTAEWIMKLKLIMKHFNTGIKSVCKL